jgi:hypothetical protein
MKTLDVRDVSKTGCRDVTNLEVTVWAYYTRLRLRLRHVTAEHVRGGDIPTAPLYPLAGRYAVKCRGPLPDRFSKTSATEIDYRCMDLWESAKGQQCSDALMVAAPCNG